MNWKFIQGILFTGSVLLLSMCRNEDTVPPSPIDVEVPDSCISTFHPSGGRAITSLEKPAFLTSQDTLPYGTRLYLKPDSVVKAGIYEMSIDSGKVWVPAKCITLTKSGEIWARRRYEKVSSPVAKAVHTVYYQRVIVVGNSITGHGPAPELGWHGDWGMAASAAGKDYLHIITKKLKALNPQVEIKVIFDVDFEQNYWKYDFAKLKIYADFKPDLVIMRIAENTEMKYLYNYEGSYDSYITNLTSKANAKVICTTSFWKYFGEAGNLIKKVANNRGYIIADLEPLWADKSNTAYQLFSNEGVGSHPSDKGMQAIADCISKNF